MKGSTHLAIGTVIGAAAAVYYPFTLTNAALYISLSAFSALSADLDGPSLLSSRVGKLSRILHDVCHWAGFALLAGVLFLYITRQQVYPILTTVAVLAFIIGFVAKVGTLRNVLVSAIGIGNIAAGYMLQMYWLIGFGLFVAIAPWLRHRGMTHTIWAVLFWAAIGWGLENQLHIEGIMKVAAAGYFSHLLADTLTPSGVKWFYPFYKHSIKLQLYK